MLRAFQNYLVVRTDTLSNEGTPYKGINGASIKLDTSFDVQKWARAYAEVVSVPKFLSRSPISQQHRGLPSYESLSPYSYKYLSDIPLEIEEGDRVYFHFNTLIGKNLIKTEGLPPYRVWYFKCRVDQVICAVRNEKIIPTSTYVLVDPDMETWEDILIPTFSNIMGPDGKPKLRPKDNWLQKKVAPQKKFLLGFVRHVGSPLKGDLCDLKKDDRILYRKLADWTNKIEGHDYFAILQRHILAKIVDGKLVPFGRNILIEGEQMPILSDNGVHLLKKAIIQGGKVVHPGDSKLKVGNYVEFGECDRQEIDFGGMTYLCIDDRNIWGIHSN